MSYLSMVLFSCLATLSLASPVARQVSYPVCPWDVTGRFALVAFSNDGLTQLVLGMNGFGGTEFSLAVITLFFLVASLRSSLEVNEPCLNRRLLGLPFTMTQSP